MKSGPDETILATDEFALLDALGVLPPKCEIVTYVAARSPAHGLLTLWKEWLRLAPKHLRSRAARTCSGLTVAVADGAELTFNIQAVTEMFVNAGWGTESTGGRAA